MFLILLTNTGARPNEILTLKRENIILQDSKPRAIVDASFAKSDKQRSLPLNNDCCIALDEYIGSKYDKRPARFLND
jgi:site-specific recombinase XerD